MLRCCGVIVTGLFVLSLGCDSKKEPSMSDALAKSDKAETDRKEAKDKEKAAIKTAPKLADDPTKVANPWTVDTVRAGLVMGTVVTYGVAGVDAKGKPVTDTYRAEIKGNNEHESKVIQSLGSASSAPQAKQVASTTWSRMSPFFNVEKVTVKLTGREVVETPAGKFDCVVADLQGFFGAHKTVWMALEKPGIYAKVVDHGNTNGEDDQTEVTYTLASITTPPA